MSARKLNSPAAFEQQPVTVEARQTRLHLSPDSVLIRKNGIEFRSASAFAPWTEMTVTLQSPEEDSKVHCTGVVVACTGNRHAVFEPLERGRRRAVGDDGEAHVRADDRALRDR